MNRKFKTVFCAVLVCLTAFLCTPAVSAHVRGDVDTDRRITAADARIALRMAVGLEEPTQLQKSLCDMDKDGKITAADARLILRLAVFKEQRVSSEFDKNLYETAHALLGQTKPMYPKKFQKWCCHYTVADVFRPALKKSGYSDADINRLAPKNFDKKTLAKALSNFTGIAWQPWAVDENMDVYVPSLLADYYVKNPDAAETFFFETYYDDIIEKKVYLGDTAQIESYRPEVGDMLFISNKTRTYVNNYPTIDHTAQIIEVYDDGSFLATEGSIIEEKEGDGMARVRERIYEFDKSDGTYVFIGNRKIACLLIARPKL